MYYNVYLYYFLFKYFFFYNFIGTYIFLHNVVISNIKKNCNEFFLLFIIFIFSSHAVSCIIHFTFLKTSSFLSFHHFIDCIVFFLYILHHWLCLCLSLRFTYHPLHPSLPYLLFLFHIFRMWLLDDFLMKNPRWFR